MQQEQMEQEAKNTAMQSMAGGSGGGGGGDMTSMGQQMAGDGMDPTQPQNPNEVPRPQSPMGSALDASVGRAAAQG